ncbi:uncharacterized protein [Henckelia pumila]|uniref:uncharacterized protein n=1 Tax=Henckelia pumila TaxID=405737 RepID=UPI003C6DCB72
MHNFSEFIVEAGLIDAGYVGPYFTWTNSRVWKRLDRVLISSAWSENFNYFKVEHLHRGSFDHCPLQISAPFLPKPTSSFRFQNMWILHPDFLQTVRLNWNNPCSDRGMLWMVAKLKRLKHHLKWWNRNIFGNVFDEIKGLEKLASQAEDHFDRDPSDWNRAALNLSKANLALGLSIEEAFWKQKAACKWAAEGERNTKVFHNMVNRRSSVNKIYRIWDNGESLDNPLSIQESGAKFFESLLTKDHTAFNKANMGYVTPRKYNPSPFIVGLPDMTQHVKVQPSSGYVGL